MTGDGPTPNWRPWRARPRLGAVRRTAGSLSQPQERAIERKTLCFSNLKRAVAGRPVHEHAERMDSAVTKDSREGGDPRARRPSTLRYHRAKARRPSKPRSTTERGSDTRHRRRPSDRTSRPERWAQRAPRRQAREGGQGVGGSSPKARLDRAARAYRQRQKVTSGPPASSPTPRRGQHAR